MSVLQPQDAGATICEVALCTLTSGVHLDISACGTPCRYRLIDCANLVHNGTIVIREYTQFPTVPYTAVSYVWKGNTLNPGVTVEAFSVNGAEQADPIGVDVLRDASVVSLTRGAAYLWLDRLCIMQTDKADKQWQIREMHKMYQSCHLCVVAPGGLQQLVRLDEETEWIHRGWTLQEAVAPRCVVVLFSWKLGRCQAHAAGSHGVIDEVTPSSSAVTTLSLILDASTIGSLSFEGGGKTLLVEVKLFSPHAPDRQYRDFPFWRSTRRIMSPNVGALARILSSELDGDMKEYSIWQSALMRTSQRPVDMVFSIMGLFGVQLDPSKFKANDRVAATIALARAILAKGGRANWFAAAFRIPPSRQISTFPVFPRTSVAGKAYMRIGDSLQEVSSLMENEYPIAEALIPMPHGAMDGDGYLHFTARALPLKPATIHDGDSSPGPSVPRLDVAVPTSPMKSVDGSYWAPHENYKQIGDDEQYLAVLVGFFVAYYPGHTPAQGETNIHAALVERHMQGKYHVRSYILLSSRTNSWVQSWSQCTLQVGGPTVAIAEDNGDALPIVSVATEQFLNNPRSQLPDVTLQDQEVRRARWAVPQTRLENTYGVMGRK